MIFPILLAAMDGDHHSTYKINFIGQKNLFGCTSEETFVYYLNRPELHFLLCNKKSIMSYMAFIILSLD